MAHRVQMRPLAGLRAVLFGAVSMGAIAVAQAQTPPVTAGTSAATSSRTNPTGRGIEEVVVTAQRREQRLSKTPVSVSVLTGRQLDRAHIVTEHDLQAATPGLIVRSSRNSEQTNYTIRGQGQDQFASIRPGVLPYINEIQIAGIGSSTAFYDLQSIQVLKGPQGTLFGRSATGGAVLFTTAKPTANLTGYVSALGGDYSQQQYEGAISGALIPDKLLARVAFYDFSRDGFQYNLYNHSNVGAIERQAVRASLTANITENLRNEFVFDYFHAFGQSEQPVPTGILPFTGGKGPPYLPIALLYSGTGTPLAAATGQCVLQAFAQFPSCTETGGPLPFIAGYYDNYFSQPNHPSYGAAGAIAAQQARGPFVVSSSGANIFGQENILISNITTYNINTNLLVRNVFGFGDERNIPVADTTGLPYGVETNGPIGAPTQNHDVTRQYSEELQFQGKALDARLNYTAGFFYANENNNYRASSDFFDLLFGGESQNNSFSINSVTYAGYAQGTYKINDHGLSVTGGIRFTSETIDLVTLPDDTIREVFGPVPPPGYSYNNSRTFDRTSFTLGLQEQLTSELLIYASGRRAYKSGGFNGYLPPKDGDASQGGNAYGVETVTEAELGSKFQGKVAGMPVQGSFALYYDWEKNIQREAYALVHGQPSGFTVNVPDGYTDGFEFDVLVKPIYWLTLGTSFAYTNAQYSSGDVNVFGVTDRFDQVTDTPLFSGNAYADVTFPVYGNITGLVHGDIFAQSKTQTSSLSLNDFGTTVPGYGTANFRVGIQDEKRGWSITANLRNAFDHTYYTGGFALGLIDQINTLIPGEPRTFTVQLRQTF